MSFKKNAFSYFIWVIFVMCNLVVFSFLSMLCAKVLGGPVVITAFGLVVAFFGMLFLIYFLTGSISRKIYLNRRISVKENQMKVRFILEGITVVCIITAGIWLRVYLLPSAGESAAYFEVAKVTQDNASMMIPVQNSVYYYLCLLHGLFLLVGNQWVAGIWLQIVLQVIASVIMYFVVRRMAGVLAAMAALGYLMFVPSTVRTSLTYGPDMLYFLLWVLGLLFVVRYLAASLKNREKVSAGYDALMWISAVPVGTLIGFLSYVDISGIVLLIPILLMPMLFREKKRVWKWVARMILMLFCVAGGFTGSLYVDGMMSNVGFLRVLHAWIITFQPEIPDIILLLQNSTVEVTILLILMAVNIFSFYRSKDKDIITVWMVMIYVMAVLYVMGITTTSMNGRFLLLVLMCVGAAVSIRELFIVSVSDEQVVAEEEVNTEQAVEIKSRFIENPLPLPKKHVKRTMDYAFVPENTQMKYDIEIPETDDFDV